MSYPKLGDLERPARLNPPVAGEKRFFVVQVNKDPSDTHAAETLEAALDLAQPDEGSEVAWAVVHAKDAGAARLMKPLFRQRVASWRSNPAGLTAKGERMYEHIASRGGPRAKEIAARTVLARAKAGAPGLVKRNPAAGQDALRMLLKGHSDSFVREIRAAIDKVEKKWDGAKVDQVLHRVNDALDAHGMEAIQVENVHVDEYYLNIIGLYVNRGDSYATTLLYDTAENRFAVGSMGDFLEAKEIELVKSTQGQYPYSMSLDDDEMRAINFWKGRYTVADILWDHIETIGSNHILAFKEHDAWELAEAVEEEGWPGFAPAFLGRLQDLVDSIV